ncbi:phytoene desaturase family protein [Streptomyces sp. S465]|uniref:phytoene desaturase family protein n=1 Tax=Streptomyces sp. S465 TaxID=2979468 RepID=UPI0022A8631A|nr:NAD(P)/FAD-dependent oxidoreductase [Streptomyces sp. S465]WAP58169.1 NAD(P)/FAD-dependent oxidoreductase [Streptomyces sp. S465]
MTRTIDTDVLVVGAGIGGLSAAAHLVTAGKRVLVVERHDRVGGRASTIEVDGFSLNTGAAMIESRGLAVRTAELVGGSVELRRPRRLLTLRIGRLRLDGSRGMRGWARRPLQRLARRALRRLPRLAERLGTTVDDIRVDQWLHRITRNLTVHSVVDTMCASLLAANAHEAPARALLSLLASTTSSQDSAFCPEGTVGLPRAIAEGIRRHGGEVRCETTALRIHVANGIATGATIRSGDEEIEVRCDHVVSDTGPQMTVELLGEDVALPQEYVRRVGRMRPAPFLVVDFASRRELLPGADGITMFARTRQLRSIISMSAVCPERAPSGWHLYSAWGVPKPALRDFDNDSEIALLTEDLHTHVDGFSDARIVATRVLRDQEPAQRAAAGTEIPYTTPIAHLWNVGDAVKQKAGGIEASADVGRTVAHEILGEIAEERRSP